MKINKKKFVNGCLKSRKRCQNNKKIKNNSNQLNKKL